ncbi:efflux RND transporter permease subunit [Bacteriovoracales bacterium]|nr:efflux RND transporter permease subunit [Bacteriovoracales bacterium]
MWFIEKVIDNKILVNMTFLGVLIFGIIQFGLTPKSDTQNVDFGIFSIEAKLPGASPTEIDQKVTYKIEKELKGIDGITKYSSTSTSGFSQVFVWVDVDLNKTDSIFNEIKGAVGAIEFNSSFNISPEVRKLNWIGQPSFTVGILSEYSPKVHELSKALQKNIESLEGVKEVSSNTIREPEISIEVIPDQLKKNEISILEVINSLNKSYSFFMGGHVKNEIGQTPILIKTKPDTLSKIREIIIRSNRTGKKIALKHLAKINLKFPELKIKTKINGQSVVDLLVTVKPDADIIKVRERVNSIIKNFSSYKVIVSSDLSKIVENRFSVVKNNAVSGLIIVFMTLLFFVNLKTTLWVVLGIPFSLFGTIGVMSLKGFMIDGLSMASIILILGIIVDDAIIVSEAINQELMKNKSPQEAVKLALKKVMVPIITTLVTTLIAFFPMFLLTGTTGKFVRIVPWSIVAALSFSFLECIFILPGHLNQGTVKESPFKNKLFNLMKNKTIKLTKLTIKYRYLTICLGLFVFLLTGYVNIPKVKFKLFPNHRTERVIFQLKFKPNFTMAHKENKVKLVEEILENKDFINDFKTTLNFFRNGKLDLYSYQMTSIDIILTPDRDRSLNAKQISELLLQEFEALNISEMSHISYNLISKNPPTGKNIEVRVIGENDKEREETAIKVERLLENLDVKSVESSAHDKRENTIAIYNENEMNRIGISKENANISIQTALSGFKIDDVILAGKKYTLNLNINDEFKKQSDFLKDIEVPSKKSTRLIPLRKFLKFEHKKEKIEVRRWKGDKITLITADSKVSPSFVEKQIRKIKTPPSVRFRFGSTDGETEQSLMGLRFTTILAVIGIYTTLALLFQSYFQPLYVLSALPMGFVGIMWGFQIHNEVYSFFSLLGALGMMGVIVNDSLVLINSINDERKRGTENFIAVATGKRIRAILLTTLTTVGGLIPLGLGIGGFEQFLSPMALSMGYGLLVGTPLIVLFIPALYSIGLDLESFRVKKYVYEMS